jgi:hypothetical protein
MYTLGIETEYKGSSIVYNNMTKTLIYYYYPNHQRLYVVDGKESAWGLPQVNEKVRVVAVFYDREVSKFKRFMKSIIKNKQIFYMRDRFFYELQVLLRHKNTKFFDIVKLYRRHTENGNVKYDR